MSDVAPGRRSRRWRRWWTAGGVLIGAAAILWVLWGLDVERLRRVVAEAGYLLLVPLAIATEQLVRA